MRETRHREVDEYLRRLQRLMSDVPQERRDEILSEIEEHINERLSELADAGAAEVRNVLERLGEPEDIAADARERFGVEPTPPRKLSKGWKRALVIAVAVLVGIPLIFLVLGALTVVEPFEGPRRVITAEQFDRVRIGDDRADVIDVLGGEGEPGSIVSGLVDEFEGILLVENPPDVPLQEYGSCWTYSVTGSGPGAQAGVCFVADEVVYKRVQTPQ